MSFERAVFVFLFLNTQCARTTIRPDCYLVIAGVGFCSYMLGAFVSLWLRSGYFLVR